MSIKVVIAGVFAVYAIVVGVVFIAKGGAENIVPGAIATLGGLVFLSLVRDLYVEDRDR